MPTIRDINNLSRDELLAVVISQAQLIEELRLEIEALKRSGRRQATPFSTGAAKTNPKKPGRKPRGSGSDNFTFRQAPSPETITEPVVEVPVDMQACPSCGGALAETHEEMAYTIDLPEVVQPRITAYRVWVCHCADCGKSVRGRHPEVAEGQHGCSATRLGRRAMAAAHVLHFLIGVPVRKVPAVMLALCGIPLTQSAITQDALRQVHGRVGEAYQHLRDSLKEDDATHTDDTGWRVGGKNAYLMVFTNRNKTIYQIRSRHRNEEVREVIPSDYAGTLITDRGRSYDAKELQGVKQQKCISHILRSLNEALEGKKENPPLDQQFDQRCFCETLKDLLKNAMVLWKDYHAGEAPDFEIRAGKIKEAVTHHLRDRVMEDADDQRLLNELGTHHDRGNLLRFLDELSIEPTNNPAERELRPAVIARKVSQCSKNDAGAHAHAAFMSVLRTLAKNTHGSIIDALCDVFSTGQVKCASP